MSLIKKSIVSLLFLGLTTLMTAPTIDLAQAAEYMIDPDHSQVMFKVKHMGISTVTGRFDLFEGAYTLDRDNLENSKVETKIVANSVNTNKQKRDKHLRSEDFLDVEKYPEITFVSKEVKKGSDDNFTIVGDLTIHGVTKSVELDAVYEGHVPKDPWGFDRTAFTASTKIDRKDFGLVWNDVLETGGLLVGDEVKIVLEIEGIKKQG